MSLEEMMELALSGKNTDFHQELLSAFYSGFPMENLRPLLVSGDPEILGLGSYLIYELGPRARSLLDVIVPLLNNESPRVRADAIIALQECATRFDTQALGRIIELLNDIDPFVQRIAMRFVQACEHGMLLSGVITAADSNPGTIFAELPGYLIQKVFYSYISVPVSADTLERLLSHADPDAVRFGVGLATRPREFVDETFIDMAAHIEDEECRNVLESARGDALRTSKG